MGLGLYIQAEIPKGGLFRRFKRNKGTLEDIAAELKKRLPSVLHTYIFQTGAIEDGLSIQLYPSEEPVDITIKDEQVSVFARTNSAGARLSCVPCGILNPNR